MKKIHLFEAVGLVDDRLVEEAADAKRSAAPWGKWLASAACIALAVSLGTAAAGTLLRGCGSKKDTGVVDMAASDSAAPSCDPAPAAVEESYEFSGDGANKQQESVPEAAPADAPPPEPAEPEVGVMMEPAAAPSGLGSGFANEEEPEDVMGSPQWEITGLDTDAEGLDITLSETGTFSGAEADIQQVVYRVENLSGEDRTEILRFTLAVGEEGLEEDRLEVRVNGESVHFNACEATVCPTADGSVSEQNGQSFLIEFNALIPARGEIEVGIYY